MKSNEIGSIAWCVMATIVAAAMAFSGCSGDQEWLFDCEEHDHCLDDEACLAAVCVEAPAPGDSCPQDHEGEVYEEIRCEEGTWEQYDGEESLAGIVVRREPPTQVEVSESFEVRFALVDEDEESVELEGVDIRVTLNQERFADGEMEHTQATDQGGEVAFELAVDEPGTDYELIASADHEALVGVEAVTRSFDVVEDSPATPEELRFETQPPSEVVAGDRFSVALQIYDEEGDRLEMSGVEIRIEVSDGEFSDGDTFQMEETNESGSAYFDLRIYEARQELELTASFVDSGGGVDSDPFDVVAAQPHPDTSSIWTDEEEVLADGQTEAAIFVALADEFDNPVVGVVPLFWASGEGNEYEDCTETDSDGRAECWMTSTVPGEKTLHLEAPLEMEGDVVVFVPHCELDGIPFGGGSGTELDPHLLCAPVHLVRLADPETADEATEFLNSSFRMTDDIDMGGVEDFSVIGRFQDFSQTLVEPFNGVFDGDGYSIENLTVVFDNSLTNRNDVALFAEIGESGVVKDLVLDDIHVVGRHRVAGLAASNAGNISGVHVIGEALPSGDDVGLLAGINTGTIEDSSGSGFVDGRGFIGGLVGQNEGVISGTSMAGTVEGTQLRVGGLAGQNQGAISNSGFSGVVNGDSSIVGGLVGANRDDGTITNSVSDASVRGTNNVGGLAGTNTVGTGGTISGSHAMGNVTGIERVGGLVGWNASSNTITDSHATADVEGGFQVGGLVGSNEGTIEESYATGSITVDDVGDNRWGKSGGFVGENSGVIEGCYASGNVDGGDESQNGGFVGYTYGNGSIIRDSYSTGPVSGGTWTAGFVGEHDGGTIVNSYSSGYVDGGLTGNHGFAAGLSGSSGSIQNCYYDQDTAQTTSSGGGGVGMSNTEFEVSSNFSGWNFSDVWEIGQAPDNHTRPILRWQD